MNEQTTKEALLCKDCPHFKILFNPIGKWPDLWDFGKATCKKHNLYVDFATKRKLNKLECIETKQTEEQEMVK